MIDFDGYKLFAGSHMDPLFGPVVLFGFARTPDRGFQGPGVCPAPPDAHAGAADDGRTRIYQAAPRGITAARRSPARLDGSWCG